MIRVQPSFVNTGALLLEQQDPQETAKSTSRESTGGQPSNAPKALPYLSRVRRELQNPAIKPDAFKTSARQFADALVEQGDRQLSVSVATNVISDIVRSSVYRSLPGISDKVAVPPNSTFGQAWSELHDALESEPFKSFAEAKLLNISKVFITAKGELYEQDGERITQYYRPTDSQWVAASSAVLTAANKLMGRGYDSVELYDRDHAPIHNIAHFYGIQFTYLNRTEELSVVEKLLRNKGFEALSSSDPLDAPLQQKQRQARQHIADLAPHELSTILENFAPLTAKQRVQHDDQALAQLAARRMIELLPETNNSDASVTLQDIPEYSTFNRVRQNLLKALKGSTFSAFAQENELDPTSVRINPVSGDLMGTAKGVNTTFNLNDVSGWSEVWPEIKDAVQQIAAGSKDDVTYPTDNTAPLSQVMAFYNEPYPQQEDIPEYDWEGKQRQLASTLRRIGEMLLNNGFKALISPLPNDPASVTVQQRQQDMVQQLAGVTLSPSPLEALAATVKANLPAESEDSAEDLLANAERDLAKTVHSAMLELKTHPAQIASKNIQPIPANGLLGQWQAYLNSALKGRGFNEWAREQNIDLTSLRYDPTDKALIAKVKGADQRFTATDFAQKYPKHFDVLTPVLSAAQAFAKSGQSISLSHAETSGLPYQWVANFYSLNDVPNSSAFDQQTALIGRTHQFPAVPDTPGEIVTWLNRQKTAQGDSNDRYALIHELKNWSPDTGLKRFVVDPNSSHHPKSVTTVAAFISNNGWHPIQSKAASDNLLAALQTPLPQSPPLGNYWGFLSTPLPLSQTQQGKVTEFVKTAITPHTNLLSYLNASVTDLNTSPGQALEQLLSSDKALELATKLQSEMKGAATATSLKQWLLTALVLGLDPTAGTPRNNVAGFDFMQAENWGLSADELRLRFRNHLIDNKQLPASLALVASHLLVAGTAPHLRVKDVPAQVTLGSTAWVSFVAAVNRIELIAPGAAAHMTYQQVMDFQSIAPISDAEGRLQAIANANPLIDWAIINHQLVKNDKDEYTYEQLTSAEEKLKTQITETSQARAGLSTFAPKTRREMALEALRNKWGTSIDYESRYLTEKLGPFGAFSGIRASIVEIYEAGRMGESWRSEKPELDFEALREQASDLPDINTQFNEAIEKSFNQGRNQSISVIKDMLSKLDANARNRLEFGRLQYFSIREDDNSVGLIIRTTDDAAKVRDFAILPGLGKVEEVFDLPTDLINPSPNESAVSSSLKAAQEAAKQFWNQHYKSPTPSEPKFTRITPMVFEDGEDGELVNEGIATFGTPNPNRAPGYFSEDLELVAKIAVDSHFLRKTEFIERYRHAASNSIEEGKEPVDYFQDAIRLLPGGSSVLDIYHGKYEDAGKDAAIDWAIYLLTKGTAKVFKLAKSGAAWAAIKASSKFIEKFGAQGVENIALRDVTATSTQEAFKQVTRMQGEYLMPEQTGGKLPTDGDIANGTIVGADSRQPIKTTAVRQDGEWYAYNSRTMSASGPALSGFRSETSIPLKNEIALDGSSTFVPENLLPEDAQVIRRASHTDVGIGDKVYRYDPKQPNVLTDLESADHFDTAQGVEAFCPAGPRVKRGANDVCFANVVSDLSDDTARLVQGLEHKRLYPSPSVGANTSTLVYERRLFDVVEKEGNQTLVPRTLQTPVSYLDTTSGTIIKDPHFGLPGTRSLTNLDQNTRIVKLDAISNLSDDKRELRGTISSYPTPSGAVKRYITVEADPLTFYYSEFDANSTVLNFKKIPLKPAPLERVLIAARLIETESLLKLSGAPLNKAFVSLPALDTAFTQLEAAGYTKQQVSELKTTIASFSDEKKREFVYQISNRLSQSESNPVLNSVDLEPLQQPENFASLTVEQQNRFYAESAKKSVDSQFKATGIGSDNKRSLTAPNSLDREQVANTIIGWMRGSRKAGSESVKTTLQFGAGNCGEMAEAAEQIIKKTGGNAQSWYVDGGDHVFTVVGGPSSAGRSTIDFSEPEWKDAWIVDPWAEISCKASDYTRLLVNKMHEWFVRDQQIWTRGNWRDATDATWVRDLTTLDKRPE